MEEKLGDFTGSLESDAFISININSTGRPRWNVPASTQAETRNVVFIDEALVPDPLFALLNKPNFQCSLLQKNSDSANILLQKRRNILVTLL